MTRRLRKFPQHHPAEGEPRDEQPRKIPFGLIWIVLTLLVLVLVIVYDRRSINDAAEHLAMGQQLEQKGLFMEALNEYDKAFSNKRLGRKAKAGAALAMAEIYFTQLEDYPAAHKYYVQARQVQPGVIKSDLVQKHAKLAAQRAQGTGVFQPGPNQAAGTTATIVQRVEILSEPMADRRGPVLAKYKGGAINAGEILRRLERRPEFHDPAFRQSPERLKAFINTVLREDLAYQAAVGAGVHKDADISTRVFDYQKQLITQRYLVDRKDLALRVDNADVEKYYQEHRADYVTTGSMTLAMIKTDTETSATELLEQLRTGARFDDVATSYSTDKATAAAGGNVGVISDDATTIPVLGAVPEVLKGLRSLKVGSVSEVVPLKGAFYIFKITDFNPGRKATVDEARSHIENILRGRSVDAIRHRLDIDLAEAFEPELDDEALNGFWDYAEKNTRGADGVTSAGLTDNAPATTVTAGSSTR